MSCPDKFKNEGDKSGDNSPLIDLRNINSYIYGLDDQPTKTKY